MVVRAETALCPACNTPLSRERQSEGLCPGCALELALEDSSVEAEVLIDPEEAPTLQYSGRTFEEGQIQGKRYRIRSLLGRGGMGEVWRAYDLKLRVDVALKALRRQLLDDTRALETLRQEVRAARDVVSPNVCRVFDLVELDRQEIVSMEYIDGVTLLDILKMRAPLELSEAREIASQFLAGLEAIHNAGLVHRDVKPENLMMTRSGRVVLMDFGIAKGLAEGISGTVSGTPAYMAPEQARGEALDARADVFSAGVVLAEMIAPGGLKTFEDRQQIWQGIHLEPQVLPDSPWAPVLKAAVAARKEQRQPSASALARALEEVTLRVAGAEDIQPYPGLAAFTEADAEYFFGRELEVEAMWKKLQRPHLLGLIGPSGAGKSSFLRAGLLPVIPTGWRAVVSTPGSQPFLGLARVLARELTGDEDAMQDLLQFESSDVAVSLVTRWRQQHDQVLIVVDQFEELFTQNPREAQDRFAELLSRLALESDAHVLLSLRDDFLVYCSHHDSLAPIFSELSPLKPLSSGAIRRALAQPALKCGYRFEDDSLVDEMVAEVSDERGALPLLAFAAARLWDHRDREEGLLTREAYEHIGGVGGALAQHAEATLEKIGQDRVPIVRELFRNLVTAQGTRAARDREELLSVFDAEGTAGRGAGRFKEGERSRPSAAEIEDRLKRPAPVPAESPGPKSQVPSRQSTAAAVLDALIDARLLTSYEVPANDEGEPPHHRIEIIHESLLTNWPRLVRWQTQDTEGAQLRDELRQAAQTWEEHDHSEDRLWTGTAFKEYEIWRERYPGSVSGTEEAFAQAMTGHAERRKRQKRTALAAVVVALLVVLSVVTWSRFEAKKEARRAEAAKLLAIAQLQLESDPTEALAFATASLQLADTEEARVFAMRALWEAPPSLDLVLQGQGSTTPAFSPDGNRVALAGHSEEVMVFEAEGGPPVVLPGHQSATQGANGAFWVSNNLLVTGHWTESRRRLWSFPGGELVREIDLGGQGYLGFEENHLFAEVLETDPETGHELHHLRSWRFPDGEAKELGTVDWTALGWSFSWFNSDASGWFYGKGNEIYLRPLPVEEGVPDLLVGWHDNKAQWAGVPDRLDRLWTQDAVTGELRLWDLSNPSGEPLRVFSQPGLEEGDSSNLFDPTGRWVGSLTRQVRVWDLEAWPATRPLTLRRSGSWYAPAARFHPRGDLLVAVTRNHQHLTFWPLGRNWPRVVDGYKGFYARPLAFSPDGQWLATVWGKNHEQLRLWPLPGNSARDPRTFKLSNAQVWGRIVFDPKGSFLFPVGGPDDSIDILTPDGATLRKLDGFADDTVLIAGAASPSGRRVATAPARNGPWTLRVWDVDTGDLQLFDLPESPSSSKLGLARGVFSVAFTDESTLYTGGDGGVRRWDLDSGTHEPVFPTQSDHGTEMEVTSDGRTALIEEVRLDDWRTDSPSLLKLLDLPTGEVRALPDFGENHLAFAIDASGTVVVTANQEGSIRVGRVSGKAPHLLLGHEGAISDLEISPDGRWIASSGDDDTLRLWPMPDLDKPPLHTLPHDELIAKLQSLTNLRAVRDPESSTGWSIEVGPFPGWKEVPEW